MVSFFSSVKTEKMFFFVLSRAWDKEKNSETPQGIEPSESDLRIHRSIGARNPKV